MAMVSSSGSGKTPQPVVNVTPLVDVALVILIVFIVVTPLMTKTFWLNLPQEADDEAEPAVPKPEADKPLVMTLDREGVVRINQVAIDRGELVERLPRMLAAAKDKVLYFDAADGVKYGAAVELMDTSRGAGARSIAILTQKVAAASP